MFLSGKSLPFFVCQRMFSVSCFHQRRLVSRTHNLTLTPELSELCVSPCQQPRERNPFYLSGSSRSESWFLFGAMKSIFQACADFASCQRLLGTAPFVLFYIILYYSVLFYLPNPYTAFDSLCLKQNAHKPRQLTLNCTLHSWWTIWRRRWVLYSFLF